MRQVATVVLVLAVWVAISFAIVAGLSWLTRS